MSVFKFYHKAYSDFCDGIARINDDPDNAGLYLAAKTIHEIIADIGDNLMADLRTNGFNADNCDGIHLVDSMIYSYIKESNPNLCNELVIVEEKGSR